MKINLWIAALISLAPVSPWAGGGTDLGEPGIPRMLTLPPQNVLAIVMQGDPEKVSGLAYKKLYAAFFAYADRAEKTRVRAPMVRWSPPSRDSAKTRWEGRYALPVSNGFPMVATGEIRKEIWEYGLVAEVLHLGPYDDETGDISALKEFIAGNGLAIAGGPEEVYVRGPSVLFQGNPKGYLTLIRYRVERIGEMPAPIAKRSGPS